MQRLLRRVMLCAALTGPCMVAAAPMPPALVTETAIAAQQAGRHAEAAWLFEHAARAGNRLAQYHYAMMLHRDEAASAEHNASWRWLRKAAAAGLPEAQFQFGLLYDRGDAGVRRSPTVAAEWYRRAAAQGHVDAQLGLASLYLRGEGLERDQAAAARWYLAAARSGDAAAQYIVAGMYEAGDGFASDLRQAAHWYRQAALQGDAAAREKYDLMRARLENGDEPR